MRNLVAAIAFLLVISPSAFADESECLKQVSYQNLSVTDSAYRDLDKLIASDLLDVHSYSDRPWSLKEVLRIIIEVRTKHEDHTKALANSTPDGDEMMIQSQIARSGAALDRLKHRFSQELKSFDECITQTELKRTKIFTEVQISRRNSSQRPNPGDVGITAMTNGRIESLSPYENGRVRPAGNSLLLNGEGGVNYGPYMHLQGSPLFIQSQQFSGESKSQAYFEKLYLKGAWKNLEVQVGRDEIAWGQKEFGGLLYSSHALPPDMIKLTSISPFSVGPLGHLKATFFLSQLGKEQIPPYHKMLAYKISLITSKRFEMGVYQLYTYGGEGSPNLSPEKQFFHFLYLPSNVKYTNDRNVGIFDFRYRPKSRTGGQYYFEMESSSLRLHDFNAWSQQLGLTMGAYYPLLGEEGHTDFRVEYTYIPVGNFRHSQWKSGSTRNFMYTGEPIGVDARQIMLKGVTDINSRTKLASTFSWNRRGSDIYKPKVAAGAAIDDVSTVSIVTDRPSEFSWRLIEDITYTHSTQVTLGMTLGLEYFRNYLFMDQKNFLAYLTAFELKYSF